MSDPLMKPPEVMELLNVSRPWLYRAAAAGLIPAVRLPGVDGRPGPWRFVREDIEAFIEEKRKAWQPGDSATATLRRQTSKPA